MCRLLDRPDARQDAGLFGTVLAHAAIAARRRRRVKAQQLGNSAVEFARQLGDDRVLIEALAALCGARTTSPVNRSGGSALGGGAVERARRLGDDVLLAASLTGYLLCADASNRLAPSSCSPRRSPAPSAPATC